MSSMLGVYLVVSFCVHVVFYVVRNCNALSFSLQDLKELCFGIICIIVFARNPISEYS